MIYLYIYHIDTYIDTCIHTYVYTCMHAYTHTHTRTHTHTHTMFIRERQAGRMCREEVSGGSVGMTSISCETYTTKL